MASTKLQQVAIVPDQEREDSVFLKSRLREDVQEQQDLQEQHNSDPTSTNTCTGQSNATCRSSIAASCVQKADTKAKQDQDSDKTPQKQQQQQSQDCACHIIPEEEEEEEEEEEHDSTETSCHAATALDEEENYYPHPESLQEELNEILEAWFDLISEEHIRAYQRYVEDIRGERVAERALQEPAMAPCFALTDQDGDVVNSQALLQQHGALVITFYRGKWCPHCNATLMRYQKELLPALQQRNVPFVAISPMLPDGTLYLASKRTLEFPVCSDTQNQVAQQFGITFCVQPHTRPFMEKWGEDLPVHNGVPDCWDIPLPAVYVIGADGRIVWSFLDNDPGVRAEPASILAALPPPLLPGTTTPLSISTTMSEPSRAQECAEEAASALRKRKKRFNRKTGYTSFRKSPRELLSSLFHRRKECETCPKTTITTKIDNDVDPSHNDDVASSSSVSRTFRGSSRTFRGSNVTSSEFLMKYVLPPSPSSEGDM